MFTEAKVEVGCPKSWYKREKNVEKSHFSDFFSSEDSPKANEVYSCLFSPNYIFEIHSFS